MTVCSTKTGITYTLCNWSHGCGMPVSTDGFPGLCRWHRRCLGAPDQAGQFEAFQSFLAQMQKAYPKVGQRAVKGWWDRTAEDLWPVMCGQGRVL